MICNAFHRVLVTRKPRKKWKFLKFCLFHGNLQNLHEKLISVIFREFQYFRVWHPENPPRNHLLNCYLLGLARRGTEESVLIGNSAFLWKFANICENRKISIKILILVIFPFSRLCTWKSTPRNHWFNNQNGGSGAPGPQKYHSKQKTTILNESLSFYPLFIKICSEGGFPVFYPNGSPRHLRNHWF